MATFDRSNNKSKAIALGACYSFEFYGERKTATKLLII